MIDSLSGYRNSVSCAEKELNILISFSKVYGYIKYFHPSDEAHDVDWDKMAILGVEKVRNAKSNEELRIILEDLFLAVAPTVTFTETKPLQNLFHTQYSKQINADKPKLKTVAWQYEGIDLTQNIQVKNTRSSNRTNRKDNGNNSSKILFQSYPTVGETAIHQIGDSLWCQIPLALYGNETNTLPQASHSHIARLKKQLESINLSKVSSSDENIRLANIIIAWNELQHFYPYFDEIDTNWESQLRHAIKKALDDRTEKDFFDTLSRMLASTFDGHIQLNHPSISKEASLPFLIDFIEDEIVVTHSLHKEIKPGDIIISLNGELATEIVQNRRKYISGSPQLTLFRSLRDFGTDKHNTEAILQIEANEEVKSYTVPRSSVRPINRLEKKHLPISGLIEEGIYYVDLDRAPMDRINEEMNQIASSPAVIFDLRGYPNRNHQVIQHLLTSPDTSDQWMKIPNIIYPDQQNKVGYQNFGWQLEPAEPHITGNVVFITDARAISLAESFMSFIEHYELAEIVGQPTAGTNGNVNSMVLPGGYRFAWTGMKVTKHDGSQHHLIGIQPTIPVDKTINGVREGRDEFLEKAIQVVQNPDS